MPFDAAGYANLNASNPPIPHLLLITIAHPELAGGVLRLVRDYAPVTSRGNVYTPTALQVRWMGAQPDRPSRASLRLDDVDKTLLDALRSVRKPAPVVTIEAVLASSPDVVQTAITGCEMRELPYDSVSIEGDLTLPAIDDVAFPPRLYTPSIAPAIFEAVEG